MKHQRISDLAASIGVSHTAIRKAINTGRIPSDLVRTKELRTGRKVTVIIDPPRARLAYLASRSRDITGSDTPMDDVLDRPEVADSAGNTPAAVSRRTWDADEIIEMIDDEYLFVRKVLMAIPAKVAESLAASADAKQIQTILEGAIGDALDDLTSDIDLAYADDTSDIELDEPTALTEEKP